MQAITDRHSRPIASIIAHQPNRRGDALGRTSLAALILAGNLLGGSTRAENCIGSVYSSNGVVGLSGCISSKIADIFTRAIETGPRLVVVQSTGGDVQSALKMAMAISAKRVPLLVRGICASSCANYIMPAALSVSVESGSVVGFHGDARITIQRMGDIGGENLAAYMAIRSIAKEEERFVSSNNRAARTHELQLIASTAIGSEVSVRWNGKSMICTGLGQSPWFPELNLLIHLNLVDRVVNIENEILPEIRHSVTDSSPRVEPSFNDPLENCIKY